MLSTPGDLPDLNVWLALADRQHPHHGRVRTYWEEESAPRIAFCRVTMLGLMRLGTQPRAMRGQPFTPVEIWQAYRSFRELPEVLFLAEPSDLEARMSAWSERADF